jgi:hypothetical protein
LKFLQTAKNGAVTIKAWVGLGQLFHGIAIIAGGLWLLADNHKDTIPISNESPSDIPRYSQSDVVYLAQQSNPGVPREYYTARFTAVYQGNTTWQLKREIGRQLSTGFTLYWYQYGSLNELTGKIAWGDLIDGSIVQPIFIPPPPTLSSIK